MNKNEKDKKYECIKERIFSNFREKFDDKIATKNKIWKNQALLTRNFLVKH